MRLLVLTHYYAPEVGAPQTRLQALVEGLRRRGVAAGVHTTFPHYPDGRIAEPYLNRPLSRECRGGAPVVRSAVYATPNRGFGRRLANHASFALSSVATAPFTGPADVVLVESPPLFTAAAGIAYAASKRATLVVNVADRWPASAIELGALTSPAAIRAAEWLERRCYAAAALITVPTAGLVAELDQVEKARGKVRLVPPAVDLERFSGDRRTARRNGPLRLVYAGTIGLAQGLDTLVEAAMRAGPDILELDIAGDGAEAPELQSRIERGRAAHVRMLGRIRHEDVPALYASADAAVVLLRDRPLFTRALPTKILEAMASGVPVILAARGEAAQLIRDSGAGIVVAPEDPDALAAAFSRLSGDPSALRALGEAGRAYARRFGRDESIDRWLAVLQESVAGGRVSHRSGRRPAP